MTMKSLYLAAVLSVVAAVPAYAGEGTCSGCPSKGTAEGGEMAAKKSAKAAKADDKATSGAVVASAKK